MATVTSANMSQLSDKDLAVPVEDHTGSNDNLSLEERDEKEIRENPDSITKDAQTGVQKAEAVALVWSAPAMYATYAWVWLCFFVLALQLSIGSNTMYYAYADFSSAPQVSKAYILATVISSVLQLPIAKTLNLWGRAEGFLFCLTIYLIGMIIMAACKNADAFAGGYTIYYVGYTTTNFVLSIFVADTVGLRNRAFAYAFIGTPSICTAFSGPLAAQAFINHSTWQWSYGCFVIIVFVIFSPLAIVLKFYERKARKMGLIQRSSSGRNVLQSIKHYFIEFDIVGGFLIMATFVLLLLPFSLETYGISGYKTATFICMIIFGAVCLALFVIWECFFARTQFIKWELFKKRTVIGGCIVSFVIFFNYATWDTYYLYFVQVVYNLSTSRAGYMNQIYSVGSTICSVILGIIIRQTRHFKYISLFFGAPLLALGAGLMVHFRGSWQPIRYLVMSQIFIAFGGGTLVIGDDMAVMSAADRESIPMVIALISLFGGVGSAVGSAVAGAIYTNTFPQELMKTLPPENLADVYNIYLGGATAQLVYPVGSPARDAINHSWAYSQRYMCIAAVCVVSLIFPGVLLWKNYNVDRRQVKGRVI